MTGVSTISTHDGRVTYGRTHLYTQESMAGPARMPQEAQTTDNLNSIDMSDERHGNSSQRPSPAHSPQPHPLKPSILHLATPQLLSLISLYNDDYTGTARYLYDLYVSDIHYTPCYAFIYMEKLSMTLPAAKPLNVPEGKVFSLYFRYVRPRAGQTRLVHGHLTLIFMRGHRGKPS